MTGNQIRRAGLAENLARVRARLSAACTAAGRAPESVTVVAITKTYPATDVALLAELGVTDVGENRDQEAAPKAAALAGAGVTSLRWHFVGQLQRNKCRSVVGYADVVQSVDSARLVRTLAAAAARYRDRPLDVLLQVSIDGAPGRGGVLIEAADVDHGLWPVVDAVTAQSDLRLAGVMAVAPMDWDSRAAFTVLAEVAVRLRTVVPTATVISAGMSADLEAAVGCGATHVRIGSALLGMRSTLR